MATISFSIERDNIYKTDRNGSGSYTFNPVDFPLPTTNVRGISQYTYLIDLLGAVGNHVTLTYQLKAAGYVHGHTCSDTRYLLAYVNISGATYPRVELARTIHASGYDTDGAWIDVGYSGSSLLTSFSTYQDCSGSGCGCIWGSNGGWNKMYISLLINVNIDLIAYCTTQGKTYIYNDLCYYNLADYVTQHGSESTLDTYMSEYCHKKYPNATLDMFNDKAKMDPKDFDICACNMPQDLYDDFTASLKKNFPNMAIGDLRPNCLLPACIVSHFKPSGLDKCPVPQCFNFVNLHGNDISGNVVVNQDNKCVQILGHYAGPGVPPNSPTHHIRHFSYAGNGTILIIIALAIALLLIIIIIGGIAWFGRKKSKTMGHPKHPKAHLKHPKEHPKHPKYPKHSKHSEKS